jgi:arabinan endo-1,5-alpha-L-arabinosidase
MLGLLAVPTAAPSAGAVPETAPQQTLRFAPLLRSRKFADPAVARYRHGYVAVATGAMAPRAVARSPRGPWHPIGPALSSLPRWATSAGIWAVDLDRVGKRWVLYYAAIVHGQHRRCIGVARSASATKPFHPVGKRPLVCPKRHHRGVIDPSIHTDGHRRYLLYKTQGTPATIRIVRLAHNGLHRHRHAHSRLLLRLPTIVENPVLIKRGRHVVLLTSQGYYGNCGYRETWRRARHLSGLRHARPHTLLDHRHTRLCGPGGADLVRHHGRKTLYFHAWVCGRGRHTCPTHFLNRRADRPSARRVLYAAHLRWHHGRPHVRALRRH